VDHLPADRASTCDVWHLSYDYFRRNKSTTVKHLAALNQYFARYKWLFITGIVFVVAANYFAVLAPQITGYVISKVIAFITRHPAGTTHTNHDPVVNWFTGLIGRFSLSNIILISSLTILLLALIRGVFMFFMRQTIIVMSRHIEYDQKNAVYAHYQQLDAGFFKQHRTGDLMNRIAEDVSRVRQYTGPAVMYVINLVATIAFCVAIMWMKDARLTLMVLAPLPLLAVTIYIANSIINKKSEKVQELLGDLTTNAQESYSGIRVIKSFVQEGAMLGFFKKNSEAYRRQVLSLAKVEAVYFPSMSLMIGLSTIITVWAGSLQALDNPVKAELIVEFIMYVNMLTFPVSAIGFTASMIQRAAASQKRINEFLHTKPVIQSPVPAVNAGISGDVVFQDVSFTYPDTGIRAVRNFNLTIKEGQKVLIMGRTGSGKSTLGQLLLRFYDPQEGQIRIGDTNVRAMDLQALRIYISYVPQDVFLFSDTVTDNIAFGLETEVEAQQVHHAADLAAIDTEISRLPNGYQTMVGERGVTLSGGQKQRISIARALMKDAGIILLDDSLSAVDTKTENTIIQNLYTYLAHKTAIIITHRIFTMLHFDQVIILDNGSILEQGTHEELMRRNGYYADLYRRQVLQKG
jgi:ATP-binding cassette subfamily B multidrug efflux pump